MQINMYNDSHKEIWDDLVQRSKNGTFLFMRNYMDYHRDRFEDSSLLVRNDKGDLIALLPANKVGNVLVSHGGLTYGGFVTDEYMKTPVMLKMFGQTLDYLKQKGFTKVIYKTIPHIYHQIPSEEDRYALFRHKAVLYRRDVTTTIMPKHTPKFQNRRLRSVKKAQKIGVTWLYTKDYNGFWRILESNLLEVHRTKPVHTLEEILKLYTAFPENIKLFGAYLNDELVAGVVIFETPVVAHAQYIASSDKGRSYGALDLLFFGLITEKYKNKRYFNFGISTEDQGVHLNEGLINFKEGFGGRSIIHDFYEISLVR